MENRENARRHWPLAVAASVLLHGAAVLGLGMLPGRQVVEARTGTPGRDLPFTLVDYDPGEVTFLGSSGPPGGKKSSTPLEEKTSPGAVNAGPATATLKYPLAAADNTTPRTPEPGSKGPGQVGTAGGESISFFQVAAHGLRIVYVVDISA